jgi:diguanylate cyclase (GGDEF)-like protein
VVPKWTQDPERDPRLKRRAGNAEEHRVRVPVLTLLAVVAMAASVLFASHVQRSTAERHGHESALAQSVLARVNRADAALNSFAVSGQPDALMDAELALERLASDLARSTAAAADDRAEASAVADQRRIAERFTRIVHTALTAGGERRQRAALGRTVAERHELADRFEIANGVLQRRQAQLAVAEDGRAALTSPGVIVLLGLLFGAAGGVAMRRARRASRRVAASRHVQERFGEALQVSESQAEAHGLLKSHLERAIPGALITVINRNNSADRLEASTPLPEDSTLAIALQEARPRSCMAVRLSRPFTSGAASEEVLSCAVCGKLASETTCQPLLVGGEVIGSVLAEHDVPLSAGETERIGQSVSQSAPVLANLRNLAIAETRAATDVLTGLPNRRAVDDTLLRMLAQAGRSFSPLSVVLLDLDHFKQINDCYGHDRGDEVLAAFSTRLKEVMRESDFAGRSGGEEFVLFLPDTDRTGAVRLAERIRMSMRSLKIPGVERDITASFGIACFPDDSVDGSSLMRSADRALYAAKRNGRDRIEASSTGAPAPPTGRLGEAETEAAPAAV